MEKMSDTDIDASAKEALSKWLQSRCDILPSRAVQYASLFAEKGVGSTKRLAKCMARDVSFLEQMGVDMDDAEEILAAIGSESRTEPSQPSVQAAAPALSQPPVISVSSHLSQPPAESSPPHESKRPFSAPFSVPVPTYAKAEITSTLRPENTTVGIHESPSLVSAATPVGEPTQAMQSAAAVPIDLPVAHIPTPDKAVPPSASGLQRTDNFNPQPLPQRMVASSNTSSFSTINKNSEASRRGQLTSSKPNMAVRTALPDRRPIDKKVSGDEGKESPHEWDSIISTANPEIFSMNDLLGHEAAATEMKPHIGRARSNIPKPAIAFERAPSPKDDGNIIKAIRRNTIGKFFQTKDPDTATAASPLTIDRASVATSDENDIKIPRRFSYGDSNGNSEKTLHTELVREDSISSKYVEVSENSGKATMYPTIVEGVEETSSSASADNSSNSKLTRILSSIEEGDNGNTKSVIVIPTRRQTSTNIFTGLSAMNSIGNDGGDTIRLTRGGTNTALLRRKSASKSMLEDDIIQIPKSFSLAKLFDKGDKNEARKPVFMEDHDNSKRTQHALNKDTTTLSKLVDFGEALTNAVDAVAGWQAVQQCNSLNAMIDSRNSNAQFLNDIIVSNICPLLVSVLLRFSDDILVAEAALDVICVICSLGETHASATAHVHGSSTPAEPSGDSYDKITQQFSQPDTYTALNAVLYHCDTQLHPAAGKRPQSLAHLASFATGRSSFVSFSELHESELHESALEEQNENDLITESFTFSEALVPGSNLSTTVSNTGGRTDGSIICAVEENKEDVKGNIAQVINLAARSIGLLSSHVPNAVSIVDCGVYDNLLRAGKSLVPSRSDIAAEICWAVRCLAVNRLSSVVKKFFMSSSDSVLMLVTALQHYEDKTVCRDACRAIVNLCAINPQAAYHLLLAGVLPLLSLALKKQVESTDTVKWITMSLSSLFMHQKTVVASLPMATSSATAATAGAAIGAGTTSPNSTTETNLVADEGTAGGFITAVRSKSTAALFRAGGDSLKKPEPKKAEAVVKAPNEKQSKLSMTAKLFRGSSNSKDKKPVFTDSNSDLMNRLRRSTSMIFFGSEGDSKLGLEDPAVAEELIVRPVLDAGLCETLVTCLTNNAVVDAATAEWLCFTIYLLALKETLLIELGRVNACTAVVGVITSYTDKCHVVMRRACTALGALCIGSSKNRDAVFKLSGHLFIIKSLLSHGGVEAPTKHSKSAAKSAQLTNTVAEELSIVQECWVLKKLAVDSHLRHSMMKYSIYEAVSAVMTKYSEHIDISLQCIKLLLVLITREEEHSLEAVLEFKQRFSLHAFMVTINICIDDVTTAKYSLILLTVLCCRFIAFKPVQSTAVFPKNQSFRKPSARDLHACTNRSCSGWHGPFIDKEECTEWGKSHGYGVFSPGIDQEDLSGADKLGHSLPAATPVCACRSTPCERAKGAGITQRLDLKTNDAALRNNMLSHYNCFSLPEMQIALMLQQAPEFIATCMKKYAHYNVVIAEWGCRAAFAMTVEGRGSGARLTPLLRRGKCTTPKANSAQVGGFQDVVGAKDFGTDNNFRIKQFAEDAIETDILRSGEILFGGTGKANVGIPMNSFSDDNDDVNDIFVVERPYHGYFQRCHRSSLETHGNENDAYAYAHESCNRIGASRMLNGDGVNFRTVAIFVKLGFCRVLSEVLQIHPSNEQVIVWAARATSNMMSSKCFIDSGDEYKIKFVTDNVLHEGKAPTDSHSHVAAHAKECNLMDSVFHLLQRSASSNPAMCQYLCETVYVMSQDPVLSAWLGGLGMCHVVFDILQEYSSFFSVCQAALLAVGGLAKTCQDNAIRFHTETDVESVYNVILSAIRLHRCEHSAGVAEEGFLAALYLCNGSDEIPRSRSKVTSMCPAIVNSILEYHNNDLGVCLAALHFVRKFTVGSEENSALISGDNGSFFKILLELMQRRVEVICGCIESAEVRMDDILQSSNPDDFLNIDVDDYFESKSQPGRDDYSSSQPIYLNSFNSRVNSWVEHETTKLTQVDIDTYYESFYSDTWRQGDGGPYSVISLSCILVSHFVNLRTDSSDGHVDNSRPSARRILIENGACELLTLILNSGMVDAICLGADFRQRGMRLQSDVGSSAAASSSEYKILMGPKTALHVLSSVVENSGVVTISRSAVMSLVAIYALMSSGVGETDGGPRSRTHYSCGVKTDACTRLLALGVGTTIMACLRSFPLIMDCLISRLSLNTLSLLSMGCTDIIARNDNDYIKGYFSPQQKSAMTVNNVRNLFKDQIGNADAWKAIIDAIPNIVSTRNPLLWFGETGLSPDDETEAITSVGIVLSACRCIISTSGYGIGHLVSGVILSQANAFNILLHTLRGLKLGGPTNVTVALLQAMAAVAHEIGAREKLDVVEVVLKYLTRVAGSPPEVLIAALQCMCSLAGGMPPIYTQYGNQAIYQNGEHLLRGDADRPLHQSEAYYFNHLHRHLGASTEDLSSIMMLQSARACSKIAKTLLRQMKGADTLSPAGAAASASEVDKRPVLKNKFFFGVSATSPTTIKQPIGVLDVIQWCLITTVTMCKCDANKNKICSPDIAESLVSLLRLCGRMKTGRGYMKANTSVVQWSLSVDEYTEMMVARGCGADVEWTGAGVKRCSYLMLAEQVIKTIICLCIGASNTNALEATLLDEICERVEIDMKGEDVPLTAAAATGASVTAGAGSGTAAVVEDSGLSMTRWFKRTVKTVKRHKSNSFHEGNVSKFVNVRAPAVILDILSKYGDTSAIIGYQGCCGLYMLCGASMGLSERGIGVAASDALLSAGLDLKPHNMVSTDALWRRHKMPLLTSAETGIGHDSESMDPLDAAHALCRLLQQYTVRSRAALIAAARLVGLLASAKCTSPIASSFGGAGCCSLVMTALNVNDAETNTCRHIMHAMAGLAASVTGVRNSSVSNIGSGERSSKPNGELLSEVGAIAAICSVMKQNYDVDLDLCMVSCKAVYFLMHSPGFNTAPMGSVPSDGIFEVGAEAEESIWTDYSLTQKQVLSSGLVENLTTILSHYRYPEHTTITLNGRALRRNSRESLLGEPASRAIMLTACMLCVARLPLFMVCEARNNGTGDLSQWRQCHGIPQLILEILRQYSSQNIPAVIVENLNAAAFAGLHNVIRHADIRQTLISESDKDEVTYWTAFAEVLLDTLAKYKSPIVVEHVLLCIAAMGSSRSTNDPQAGSSIRPLFTVDCVVEDARTLRAARASSAAAAEALGAKGACERVMAVLHVDEAPEVVQAALQAYYSLLAYGGGSADGEFKNNGDFGNRTYLCSEKSLRRVIAAGEALSRNNIDLTISLCRIIAYVSSCSLSETCVYQGRLLDHKATTFLKNLFSIYADNADVIQAATIAIAFLAHHNNKSRDRLGAAGLVEPICAALPLYTDVDEGVVWCCLFALVNLSANNAKNAFKIGACGACDAIVKAIKLYGPSQELCHSSVGEWTIDCFMGRSELSDSLWLTRFAVPHYGDVLAMGCYAVVNIASFSDVLSLPLVSARMESQLLTQAGRDVMKSMVMEFEATRNSSKAGGDDPRLYGTNLSRFRASGACELLVDLLKEEAGLHDIYNQKVASGEGDQEKIVADLKRLICSTKAATLAALRLCDDVTNVQRMRSRGVGVVLASPYFNNGLSAVAAADVWRGGTDFWQNLIKDSVIYVNCFGKSYCTCDIATICKDIRRKVEESASQPKTTISNPL